MSSASDIIDEAARSGRLEGLTLYRSPKGWQASAKFTGRDGWFVCIDAQPSKAVAAALAPLRDAPSQQPDPASVFD